MAESRKKTTRPAHISQADWDAVDSPPLNDEFLAKMRPVKEAAPGLIRKRGRPKSDAPKEAIKLRLSQDVLAYFRSTGPGWQTRIDETLRKAVKNGKQQ